MAAILRGDAGNERRLPQHAKAVAGVERRQAAIFRVDEKHAPLGVDPQFMDVDIPRRLRVARDQHLIEGPIAHLAGPQHIFQPPQLIERAQVEPARPLPVQAHGAREFLLIERYRAIGQHADQEQLPALVAAESDACTMPGQPVRQAARNGQVGFLVVGGRRGQ